VAGAVSAYSHDGSMIAAGVYDYDNDQSERYRILAWDAKPSVIAELPGHSAEIDRIAFTLDDRFLISVSGAEHVVRQWNVAQRRLERVVDADATWFDLSPSGRYVLTSGPGSDRVWDVLTGEAVRTAPRLNGRITSPVYDRAGARIAFGFDSDVIVRDARSGAALLRLKGHTRPVDRVAFSSDGRMLASSSLDGIIRVWNAETGALVNALANPLPAPNPQQALLPERRVAPQIAFSPDGGLLASGSFQSEVRIWTMASPGLSKTLSADGEAVAGIAFSPDGASIAALSRVTGGGRAQVWAVATGRPSLFLGQGSKNNVGDLAFSPDGQLIAVASDHQTVNLWRASDGTLVSELTGHKGNVTSLAFNADGSRLASGAADKSAIVWDVARATAVFSDTSHTDAVDGIAFSPNGQTVATSSAGDGSIVSGRSNPRRDP
jgi:WD40 repeat protein